MQLSADRGTLLILSLRAGASSPNSVGARGLGAHSLVGAILCRILTCSEKRRRHPIGSARYGAPSNEGLNNLASGGVKPNDLGWIVVFPTPRNIAIQALSRPIHFTIVQVLIDRSRYVTEQAPGTPESMPLGYQRNTRAESSVVSDDRCLQTGEPKIFRVRISINIDCSQTPLTI